MPRSAHRALALAFALVLAVPEATRASDPLEPAAAPPVPASAPARPAPPAEPPFAGVAIGDDVNLRAGPGVNYEVVTKLAGGEQVAVLGEAFGWYLVRPARDVRTFVHKDLVEIKGAGVGIVLKDRVNVRSRAAAEATVVGQVSRGDLVRVLGQEGDFVALAAPPGSSFYVHRDLVRAAGPLGPEHGPAAAPRPTAPADTAPLVAPAKVRRARELYLAELEKPDIDAMDFGPARALFEEALSQASDLEVKRAAERGIERIKIAREIQEDYRRRMKPIGELLK